MTPDLRRRLEEASAAHDPSLSLSQEIDRRLRLSFDSVEEKIVERFGGSDTYQLLRALSEQIKAIEKQTGRRWWRDRYTFDECQAMITENLRRLRPTGRRIVPKGPAGAPGLGKRTALIALAELELINSGSPFFREASGVAVSLSSLTGKVTDSPLPENLKFPPPPTKDK
jgi:hypothetical protein